MARGQSHGHGGSETGRLRPADGSAICAVGPGDGWRFSPPAAVPLPQTEAWVCAPSAAARARHQTIPRQSQSQSQSTDPLAGDSSDDDADLTDGQAAGFTCVLGADDAGTILSRVLDDARNARVKVLLRDTADISRLWDRLMASISGAGTAGAEGDPGRRAPASTPLFLGRPLCLIWAATDVAYPAGPLHVQLVLSRSVTLSLSEGHTTPALITTHCIRHALGSVPDVVHPLMRANRGRSHRRHAPQQSALQFWRLYLQSPQGIVAVQVQATRPLSRPPQLSRMASRPPRRHQPIRRALVFGLWVLVRLARLGYGYGAGSVSPSAPQQDTRADTRAG